MAHPEEFAIMMTFVPRALGLANRALVKENLFLAAITRQAGYQP